MAIVSLNLSTQQKLHFFFFLFSMKFTCCHSGINDSVVVFSLWIMTLLGAKFLNGSYVICFVLKIGYVWFVKRADILYLSASLRRSNY